MMNTGYTTGVFDLFHVGHLNILRSAKSACDFLIVGVTTDELSEKEKGNKPVIPFAERVEIVSSIKYVDRVVSQMNYDKFEAWQMLHFNKMFVGDDWKGTEKWEKMEAQFKELGVEIMYFPYTTHTSSTKIRRILELIEAGYKEREND